MKTRRKSLILGHLSVLSDAIRRAFMQSAILGGLQQLAQTIEYRYKHGIFGFFSDHERGRATWQFRLRRFFMKAFEGSVVLNAYRALLHGFLHTSVGSLSCFGFLFGIFSLSVSLTSKPLSLSALLLFGILIFLSVPNIRSDKSVLSLLRSSVILGWLLFDVCGCSKELLKNDKTNGKPHLLSAALLAICFSVLCRLISPLKLFWWIAALACAAFTLSMPERGLCGLLLLLPFMNCFSHPTVLMLVLSSLVIVSWLLYALCGRRRLRFGVSDFLVLVLVVHYLVAGVIGFGGKSGLYSGLSSALMLLLWFPSVNLLIDGNWKKKAIYAICLSCSFTSGWGILEYFMGKSELRWVDTERFSDIGGRVISLFDNPNVLAIYLLLTVPISVCLIFFEDSGFLSRCLGVFSLLSGLLCIALTWSRGAWLGILLAGLVFLLFYSNRSSSLLPIAILSASAFSGFLPSAILNRFSSIASFTESSIQYRLYTWKGVLRLLLEYPFGVGAGNQAFSAIYQRYAISGTETALHPHSLFLRISCEIGFLGAGILLLLLLHLTVRAVYTIRDHNLQLYRLSVFCALVGALVMGFFDDIWYHVGLMGLFVMLLGFFSQFSAIDQEGEVQNEG